MQNKQNTKTRYFVTTIFIHIHTIYCRARINSANFSPGSIKTHQMHLFWLAACCKTNVKKYLTYSTVV
uniref:Uncharacterized protein n=1 Tax=Ciona intestinalis TaxID=7719 RepID=H2XTK0_CIOIN